MVPRRMVKILENHISDKGLIFRLYSELLKLNNTKVQTRTGGVAQAAECLLCKCETLSSNTGPTHTKKYNNLI
jgi:hypothetical protein